MQESNSSAAAAPGNPASTTTAMHANNRYVEKRICIARGLRRLVGAAGTTDRHFPDVHLFFSRVAEQMVHQRRLDARFPLRVTSCLTVLKSNFRFPSHNGHPAANVLVPAAGDGDRTGSRITVYEAGSFAEGCLPV